MVSVRQNMALGLFLGLILFEFDQSARLVDTFEELLVESDANLARLEYDCKPEKYSPGRQKT